MAELGAERPRASSALALTLTIQALASAAVIAPTAVAPLVTRALGLPASAVGLHIAIVYAAAMCASVLSGRFIVRFGPVRTSQGALVLCALGLALIAAGTWPSAALGALLVGLGYGPITPASSQLLARTTPRERMGVVFSLKQTGVPLGGVIAGLLVPPVAEFASWLLALGVVAVLSLVCAAAAELSRAGLDGDVAKNVPRAVAPSWSRPIRMVWSHPSLRTMAACSFVFSMVQVSLTAYTVSYLNQQLHWSLVAAGLALSVSQIAGAIGRVLWGFIADRGVAAARLLMLLALCMLASGIGMLFFGPGSPRALVMLALVLYGATAIGWNGVYLATVARLAPEGQAGVATGGTLAFTFLGVVGGLPLFGLLAGAVAHFGVAFAATAGPLLLCVLALRRVKAAG